MRRLRLFVLVLVVLAVSPGVAAAGMGPPLPDVTTINGVVPPLTTTFAFKSQTVSVGNNGNGYQTKVIRTTRKAGTRSPIHTHDFGGTTCVLKGQMTLYMDGHKPLTKKAGFCYFMPPGHLMSGVNTGKVTAVMLDIFTVPIGDPVWTVRQPGFRGGTMGS